MNLDDLGHSWDLSPRQAIALQKRLSRRVRDVPLPRHIRCVIGTDCAFLDGGKRILAGAVAIDPGTMKTVESAHAVLECTFPYLPGLLSFREVPGILEALNQLESNPDLIICDGQGLAHPRGLGLACHLGLRCGLPTIGVAKSLLCGHYRPPGANRGCNTSLRYMDREVGRVLRTRTRVKPVFVSVGHLTTLADATRWALRLARGYRLPEPTRRAHIYVTRLKVSGDLRDCRK